MVFKTMIYRLFILFAVLNLLQPCLYGQELDSEYVNVIRQTKIDIRADDISIYNKSPMIINGKAMHSKQVWDWVMKNSIFEDTVVFKEKTICIDAQVIDIDYGESVVVFVLYADNHLYEVISLNDTTKEKGIIEMKIGEKYSLVLFPYYNFPFTMAYHRNYPIFIDGHVFWIFKRKLHSNIFVSPDIEGGYFNPSNNKEKKILKSVSFPVSLLRNN